MPCGVSAGSRRAGSTELRRRVLRDCGEVGACFPFGIQPPTPFVDAHKASNTIEKTGSSDVKKKQKKRALDKNPLEFGQLLS